MYRKINETYVIGKDTYLQLFYSIELNIYGVDMNYLDGLVIFNMMTSENESTAQHFFNQIKAAYEAMIY